MTAAAAAHNGERFRPRLIIWQVAPGSVRGEQPVSAAEPAGSGCLDQHECLLVIDSIARLAKPIIVIAGDHPTHRADLPEIISYGTALGLKMVIEVSPEDLTEETLDRFRPFGPRVFRLVLDRCIAEDIETRFRRSPEFVQLESAVERLQAAGFEVHFSLTVSSPDIRKLNFNLDYAFRRSAKGLYCHLRFPEPAAVRGSTDHQPSPEEFLSAMGELKPLLPCDMYFSPQCVKFSVLPTDGTEPPDARGNGDQVSWTHWCMGGKTFAFITSTGIVRPCEGSARDCGSLRLNGYDFKALWLNSQVFRTIREHQWSCGEARVQYTRRSKSRRRGATAPVRQATKE